MRRALFGATIVVGLLAAVGCGANNRASLPGVTAVKTPQKVAFVLKVPVKTPASSAKRAPAYVSPNTQSVSFAVSTDGGTNFGDPQAVAVDTASATQCPQTAGYYVCTVAFDAQPGSIVVLVKTFASTDGSGNALSQIQTSENVTEGGSNTLTFTLDGVAAKFAVILAPSSVDAGVGGTTVTATWSALDDSGATIVAPGGIVDSAGTALGDPTLTIADSSADFGTPTYDAATKTWTMTYDGANISDQTFTVSKNAANSGVTDGTTTLTVNPAPTPSASPSPTASPTATPTTNAITNGDFATGTLTNWYLCYAQHAGYTAPVSPYPTPTTNGGTQGSANVAPTTKPSPDDASVQESVPGGYAPPSGNTNFALVGHSSTATTGKGQSGICQDVTVPSGGVLSFNVFEGGNDTFANDDVEADIYSAGSFAIANGAMETSAAPALTLFAEDNCYDNLQNNALYLSSPWGSGSHPAASGQRYSTCPYFPGGIGMPSGSPGGGSVSLGGYWYSRSFDVSAYGGQSVTIFLGIYRKTGAGSGGASSPGYYNYAYFDDVVLSGS